MHCTLQLLRILNLLGTIDGKLSSIMYKKPEKIKKRERRKGKGFRNPF